MRVLISVRFLSDVLFSFFFMEFSFLTGLNSKVVEKSQGTGSKSLHVWNLEKMQLKFLNVFMIQIRLKISQSPYLDCITNRQLALEQNWYFGAEQVSFAKPLSTTEGQY